MLCGLIFQRCHSGQYAKYIDHKTSQKEAAKRKVDEPDSGVTDNDNKKPVQKQGNIKKFIEGCSTQSAVDAAVMKYIVSEFLPLSTVEKTSFRELVNVLSPSTTVICRKTLCERLDVKTASMVQDIRDQLEHQLMICTTADIWSSHRKSYLGMTAHWVTDDISRKSVALACRRIKGSHTYSVIAELIMNIHSEYGLDHRQIQFTVTDNGANMVKAFVEYQDDTGNSGDDSGGDEDTSSSDDEDIMNPIDLDTIMTSAGHDEVENPDTHLYLPKHLRCASHTLNLVATTDLQNIVAKSTGQYKSVLRSSMAKCSKLWSNVSRSTKSSDILESIVGISLRSPGETRWNSTYDAVKRLLEPRVREKLPQLLDALKLPRFTKIELEVLEEYVRVMSSIATALDKLQGKLVTFLTLVVRFNPCCKVLICVHCISSKRHVSCLHCRYSDRLIQHIFQQLMRLSLSV